MADNFLSNITTKQKITGLVLVVVVAIIGWQVMGLLGSDTQESAATPTQPQDGQTTNGQSNAGPPKPPQPPQQQVAHQLPVGAAFLPSENRQIIEKQQKNLAAYVDKVNKLQSLKVEREIAETSEAIASANLSTAKSDKDLSILLTAPAQPTVADYAGKLAQNQIIGPGGALIPGGKVEASEAPAPLKEAVDYVVVSISMQLDKWTAVLGFQGKLYSVGVGDILPADGAVVTRISNDSVTLMRGKKLTKINMLNSIG